MSDSLSPAELALREAARDYHRLPTRGKISVTPTKPLSNQRDLSLAYSPGVAYPCLDIQADPLLAPMYRTLPLRTRSSNTRRVSSMGVNGSEA